eukprot:1847514-Alexandrium_andersonii.AAC.1
MVHVRVQPAPVRARRAAHHRVWPRGAEDADGAVAILGSVGVPRDPSWPWAQVECPGLSAMA